MTGKYLAAAVDNDTTEDSNRNKLRGSENVYHLVTSNDGNIWTLFELNSTTIERLDQPIPRYTPTATPTATPTGTYTLVLILLLYTIHM